MPPVLRSQANHSIALAREVFGHFGISLPAFSRWSVAQWQNAGPDCDEIRDCMLGRDVTDFGSGRFHEIGRCLFTLRNGRLADSRYPKSYAEKLIIDPEGQRAPAHYHQSKREDIVCRAGGNIIVELTATEPDGSPSGRRFALLWTVSRAPSGRANGCVSSPAKASVSRLGRFTNSGGRKDPVCALMESAIPSAAKSPACVTIGMTMSFLIRLRVFPRSSRMNHGSIFSATNTRGLYSQTRLLRFLLANSLLFAFLSHFAVTIL